MAKNIGSVEFIVGMDGKALPVEAAVEGAAAGRAASAAFNKSFNTKIQSGFRATLSRMGSDLARAMRANGDLSGISFTDAMKETIRGRLDGLTREMAEVFADKGGLDLYAKKVGDVRIAHEQLQKSLIDLNKEGRINDQMWRRLSNRVSVWSRTAKVVKTLSFAMGDVTKSTLSADKASGGFLSKWKTLPRGLRVFTLIGVAIASGAEQIATLAASIGPALTVLATSALGAGLAAGVLVAGIRGMSGDLKDIAPAARPAAKALQAMGSAFKAIQDSIQGALFVGLEDEIQRLTDVLLPVLADGFTTTASTVNGVLQRIATALTSDSGVSKFRKLFEGLQPVIKGLGDIIINVVSALGDILVASLPFTQAFIADFEKLTSRFSAWTSSELGQNKLKDWFSDGLLIMGKVLDLVGEIGKGLGDLVNKDSVSRSVRLLENLSAAMQPLFGVLKDLGSLDAFGVVAAGLEAVFRVLRPVTEALAPLLETVSTGLINAFKIFGPLLQIVATMIFGPLQGAFSVLNIAIQKLSDYLQPFFAAWQTIADIFGRFVQQIWEGVQPAFSALFDALIKLLPSQEEMGRILNEVIIPAVQAAADWIVAHLVPALVEMVQWITANVVPAFQLMVKWIVGDLIPGVREVFTRINEFVQALGGWDVIFDSLKAAGKAFITFGSIMWNALIAPLNLLRAIQDAIAWISGRRIVAPVITTPGASGISRLASGYMTNGPMYAQIGEAGREAVVPMDRPLSQVNPDVRALSAFAQGLPIPGGSSNTTYDSKDRNVTIMPGAVVVTTRATDGEIVAEKTVDEIIRKL
jgi:hypothetical protein